VSPGAGPGDHARVSRSSSPSNSIPLLLGRRLRALRKHRKLTQEKLGERGRLSGKFVGEIERGVGNPSLDVLVRITGALDIELEELFHFEEQSPRGPTPNAARGFAAKERVVQYLAKRPPGDSEKALRILEVALGDGEKPDR
jgi:transcriptional regulator with XRE-family HTH domain